MDKSRIAEICNHYGDRPDALLEILHNIQKELHYLPKDTLVEIANVLNISRADIYGVVSFYDDFRLQMPTGPCIKICRAEACQAVGGETLAQHAKETGIKTHDVYCLGNCALGPAVMIEDTLYGRVTRQKLDALAKGIS